MGLDDLKPFNPEEKVIEYLLAKSETSDKLMDLSCHAFANETASESPAPGGGSVSAYVGALGVALGTMVANLSAHKPGWDERWEEFSHWAEKGQQIKEELLWLVEEDTRAFNKIIEAFGLPSGSEQEKIEKNRAIQDATQYAIDIPYKTLLASFKIFELCEAMVKTGNPNSISDAGVGALCARASMRGAYLNMKINATSLEDKKLSKQLLAEAEEYLKKAEKIEATLMEEVMKIIEK
jgi:glutamate formiminotransferase/formiminotetrahydrofolate cyclodeaminase